MCHNETPLPVSGGEAVTESTVAIPLSSGTLPATLYLPDANAAPAVLIFHDIHGVNDFYRDLARRLALAGYVTLLPDFFHRQGPTDDSREANAARKRAMEQAATFGDIQAALLWLRHHERASGSVGMIGFCMGGTFVMLAASREPALDAAVSFYGFPAQERTPTAPVRPDDEDEVANIKAPLLAFWGEEDAGVGMDNVDAYTAKLKRYSKPIDVVRYPGIGHAFLTFDPAKPTYEPSQDAWSRTLTFLGEKLGTGSRA
jgi:carboxymethylenebutenolidase